MMPSFSPCLPVSTREGGCESMFGSQFGSDFLAKCIKVRDARVPAHGIEAATCRLSPLAGLFDSIKCFGLGFHR